MFLEFVDALRRHIGGVDTKHAHSDLTGLTTGDPHTQYALDTEVPQPNLVLNSDFSRRTKLMTFMPEVFADLSGWTKIDAGAAGSVAANIFTQGAANNEYASQAGSFMWRDGRASAAFKAVSTTGSYTLRWRINATDNVQADFDGAGLFRIAKTVAGTGSVVTSVAQALTLNNWYWLEIEKQGTTIIVKIYNTGVTTPGTTKAASTLLQTLTGTVSDASVQVGAHISIISNQANAQWGGLSTGDGGVYVEGYGPESWVPSFLGTKGGQAIGFDETADAGPIGKQWAMRVYIPATSRTLTLYGPSDTDASSAYIAPSTAHIGSLYLKTSGKGGSGDLLRLGVSRYTGAAAFIGSTTLTQDSGETAWTRKSAAITTDATCAKHLVTISVNPGATATGTAFFLLPQLEQGSAATAWRNAPADDGPLVWELFRDSGSADITTTSATFSDVDSRGLALNFFLPWDANVVVECEAPTTNGTTATLLYHGIGMDALIDAQGTRMVCPAANAFIPVRWSKRYSLAAGKHRTAMRFATNTGTMSVSSTNTEPKIRVVASRGK